MILFKYIFFLVFFLSRGWDIFLYLLNLNHSLKRDIPQYFKNCIDQETYFKSKNYLKDKTKFFIFQEIFNTILIFLGLIYLFPLFEKISVDLILSKRLFLLNNIFSQSLIFFIFLGIFFFVFDLPFDIYLTFNLEKKYGFSKITVKTYFLDKIKIIFIGITLGFLILIGFTNIILKYENWWLIFSIISIFLVFLINIIYPWLLIPLFYKFEKLEKESLRKKIEDILKKEGVNFKNIYVINASSRSLHTNAFFSGIGKFKKIVFYDTLINNHEEDEITSIFAHELAHYRKGHIFKLSLLSSATILIFTFLLNLLTKNKEIFLSFNFCNGCFILPYFYSTIFLSSIFSFFEFIINYISRKFEFEADKYAAILTSKESMINSLIKIVKQNLSNLNPHPLFSKFKYTHPPPIERIEAIYKIDRSKY